jgi:hypothetical protein
MLQSITNNHFMISYDTLRNVLQIDCSPLGNPACNECFNFITLRSFVDEPPHHSAPVVMPVAPRAQAGLHSTAESNEFFYMPFQS